MLGEVSLAIVDYFFIAQIYLWPYKSEGVRVTLHRFPKNANIRKWLDGLELSEDDITTDSRICSQKQYLHLILG